VRCQDRVRPRRSRSRQRSFSIGRSGRSDPGRPRRRRQLEDGPILSARDIVGRVCCERTRWRHEAIRHLTGLAGIGVCLVVASCSAGSGGPRAAKGSAVLLVPEVNAGVVGWCLSTPPGSGCARGRSRPPVIAETWSSRASTVTFGYALTAGVVRSVSVDGGGPIATQPQDALPDSLRSVAVEIPGLDPERERLPRFTPRNAAGEIIGQSPGRGAEFSSGSISTEVHIRNIGDPAWPRSGACRIVSKGLVDVTAHAGSVISAVRAYSGLIGEGYISCASTSYTAYGWPLLACVLLDASHPGAAPRPLPEMKPLRGHEGVFYAPGPEGAGLERGLVARRIPGGWLVVSRAKLEQRVKLLEHLHAEVRV
jgi:hypothetical protein